MTYEEEMGITADEVVSTALESDRSLAVGAGEVDWHA